ncbi:hypothetical protein PD5205_00065 [Xanthomonas fragariae]|uniref:Uncharacterized protein n=1 Tax=Xanthomonas fragariae TaxID=48664 RepID=A0A1Y6H2G7_9XANT|nr:hypothetical protein [Xanthomonas fragariae]WIY72506.1 hypothetical protein OW158_00320 [Xanthomonas fragariae]SMQ97336.1 hypothetical protein PD885_00064 [Xanthomonas fragariae]SMR01389.1 hypothetical protein PD5205_00065 [Xanthomonas fragariae]
MDSHAPNRITPDDFTTARRCSIPHTLFPKEDPPYAFAHQIRCCRRRVAARCRGRLSLSGCLVLALVNSLAKCKAVVVEKAFGWAEWPHSRHGACSRAAWW